MNDAIVREFQERGVVKVDYVALVGDDTFEALCGALRDAETETVARAEAGGAGRVDADVFFRTGPLLERYPEVEAAVRAPGVGELVARLAGVERMRRWSDETFFKPAGAAPCAWHQDFPHYPMDRRGLLTVWVAIEDVTADMGPVTYYPGSHRLGSRGPAAGYGRGTSASAPGELGTPEAMLHDGDVLEGPVSFPLRAGEAAVHDGLTIHGSDRNRSDRMRRGWASIYFPADARFTVTPSRPEAEGIGLVPGEVFDHPRFPIVDN